MASSAGDPRGIPAVAYSKEDVLPLVEEAPTPPPPTVLGHPGPSQPASRMASSPPGALRSAATLAYLAPLLAHPASHTVAVQEAQRTDRSSLSCPPPTTPPGLPLRHLQPPHGTAWPPAGSPPERLQGRAPLLHRGSPTGKEEHSPIRAGLRGARSPLQVASMHGPPHSGTVVVPGGTLPALPPSACPSCSLAHCHTTAHAKDRSPLREQPHPALSLSLSLSRHASTSAHATASQTGGEPGGRAPPAHGSGRAAAARHAWPGWTGCSPRTSWPRS